MALSVKSCLQGTMLLAAIGLLGGWGALLLARSQRPAPPLPPYEIPAPQRDEPPPEPPTTGLAESQTLVYNNGVEPQTLDPTLMTGLQELNLATALFEGLTSLHPKTLRPLPGIAERWEVSPNGRTYRFHLRPSRWSDGRPLTAHDFVFAWRRALAPNTAAQYAQLLYVIQGAEPFNRGTANDPATVGVKALDDLTLEVRLERPVPYFLDLAAFGTLYPVPREAIERHGERWTHPPNIVSNGPFILTAWRPHDRIELRKNPHYWDASRVLLEEIRVLAIDDAETSFKKFIRGEVDWIREVPSHKVAQASRLPGFRYSPQLGTYFLRCNVTRKPLDDPRVRKALALAIDKDGIAHHLLRAGQRAARSLVPPLLAGYQPAEGPGYDPAEARRLLAEAGFPGGSGLPTLSYLFSTSEAHQQIAEALQYMWRTQLGVRVRLFNQERKVWFESVANLDYDIAHGSWVADYADPATFLDCFTTGNGNNRTGWGMASYDSLLAQAAGEADEASRLAVLRKAESILVGEQMPIIPLYFYANAYLVRPTVRGVEDNFRNFHPFRYIYMAAD